MDLIAYKDASIYSMISKNSKLVRKDFNCNKGHGPLNFINLGNLCIVAASAVSYICIEQMWDPVAINQNQFRMKKTLPLIFTLVFFSTCMVAQEYRIKAFFIPVFEHSIAGEVLMNKHLAFQMAYQNHNELGDNRYFHHRIMPSVRYYFISDDLFLDRFYGEFFHRSAFIRHIPDQSDASVYKYNTQSVGLSAGKQIIFRRNVFMDLSFGHYYIYAGDAEDDYSDFNFFNYSERNRWRIDIKIGWILGKKSQKKSI